VRVNFPTERTSLHFVKAINATSLMQYHFKNHIRPLKGARARDVCPGSLMSAREKFSVARRSQRLRCSYRAAHGHLPV